MTFIMTVPIERIGTADLRSGMLIDKEPSSRRPETIGRWTGQCEKGVHFDSNCYDWIAKWWRYERINT